MLSKVYLPCISLIFKGKLLFNHNTKSSDICEQHKLSVLAGLQLTYGNYTLKTY